MPFPAIAVAAFLATAVCGRFWVVRVMFLRAYAVQIALFVADIALVTLFPGARVAIDLGASIAIVLPPLVAFGIEWMNARAWQRAAPFEGCWRVVSGGAWRARNHHQVASDQRFAYDFVRLDGASVGSALLAPIAGRVVATSDGAADHPPSSRIIEDRKPFGNFVALANDRATVILAHMQCGSVRVRVGDAVAIGTPLGACGNSGRTSRPHLHIHAQSEPQAAPFRGTGIPIAFARDGHHVVSRFGDRVNGRLRRQSE
jgi:hypothetical protein